MTTDHVLKQLKEGQLSPQQALNEIEKPWKHISQWKRSPRGGYKSLPIGLPTLEKHLILKQGVGEMVILAGVNSHGKSALALQFMRALALKGGKSLLFSMEMTEQMLADRHRSFVLGKPVAEFGKITDERMLQVDDVLSKLPMFALEGTRAVEEIASVALNCHSEVGLDLVVIDHFHLLPNASDVNALREISHKVRDLARKLERPVLLLAQLNRDPVKRAASKEPGAKPVFSSDLQGTGALEQDADVIVVIWRQEQVDGSRPFMADVGVIKNRNVGMTGWFEFQFSHATGRFVDPREILEL